MSKSMRVWIGLSALGGTFLLTRGINVRGMEQSAREGDVGGIFGHAIMFPLVFVVLLAVILLGRWLYLKVHAYLQN